MRIWIRLLEQWVRLLERASRSLFTYPDADDLSGTESHWSAEEYLLPTEQKFILVRMHPGTLLLPLGFLVLSFAASVLLSVYEALVGPAAVAMAWCVLVAAAAYALIEIARWWVKFCIATKARLMLTYGLRERHVESIPLSAIQDLSFQRTMPARLLGYGTFIIALTGDQPKVRKIKYLPYPEQLYLEVVELMLPATPDR